MSAAAERAETDKCRVSVSTHCDTSEWDAFVHAQQDGSFFHLSGWGAAVKRSYGYETHYIVARRDGIITGVLALTDARTRLLGRSLISTAFSVGGGPLACDEEALTRLLDAASEIGIKNDVQYIECRSKFDSVGWQPRTGAHATFDAPLITDETKALEAIPRKRRAEVRKCVIAERAGDLSVRHDGSVDEFYQLYAQSVHRLGTPVFPKRFLVELLKQFANNSEISVVGNRTAPIASLVSFYFNGVFMPYYVGASNNARDARAFDFLYWTVMRRAAQKGCSRFDFGRSKLNSGAYQYKKLWGFEPRPVQYQVKLVAAKTLPDVSVANPKFTLFSKVWPKLPPVVADNLGPVLAPNFP